MPTRLTGLTGCAGEHFVAFRLSAMGFLVAMTRGGAQSVDLMVSTADGLRAVTIQVKTASNARYSSKKRPEEKGWYWRVGAKAERLRGKSVFYAFVDMREPDNEPPQAARESMRTPDVFIVPADFVADHLNLFPNDAWFNIPETHNDDTHKMWGWDLIKKALLPDSAAEA